MQAIITKVLPSTNTRGTRIKASCERGSITISYHYSESGTDKPHRIAAEALIQKFCKEDFESRAEPYDKNPWNRPFVTGGTKDFYCHVYVQ